MILYAKVPLTRPDPAALARAARYLDASGWGEWLPYHWPHRLNVLHWPRGASRHARGLFLATGAQADAIRREIERTGNPQVLRIDDGTRSVETALYLLPPLPLARTGSGDWWLLPLADARYFWAGAGAVTVAEGSTTWAQLFAQIAAALGVTLAADAVPAAYLYPPASLSTRGGGLAELLDRAAGAAGLRVVRSLSGAVRLMAPEASLALHEANLAPGTRLAGGELALTPGPPDDRRLAVPPALDFLFPSEGGGAAHVERVTLASLDLPAWRGVATPLVPVPALWATAVYSAATAAEVTALAAQAARDWYLWRLGRAHLALIGCQPWIPEGHAGLVEWEQGDLGPGAGRRFVLTRARGLELDAEPAPLDLRSSAGSSAPPTSGGVTYDHATINWLAVLLNVLAADSTINIADGLHLTVNGPGQFVINAPLEVCGWLSWCYVDVTLTGDVTDWEPPSVEERVVFRVDPGGSSRSITGIVPAVDGQVIVITNAGDPGEKLTVAAAGNVALVGDVILDPGESLILWIPTVADSWVGLAMYDNYKSKVTAADHVDAYLDDKIVAGTNVSLAVLNPGADEKLQINGPSDAYIIALGGGGAVTNTLDADEGADHTITASGAWQDTGVSLAGLPAGVYLLWAEGTGRCTVSLSGPGELWIRLYDVTNSTIVGVTRSVARVPGTGSDTGFGRVSHKITLAGATTFRVEAFRDAGPTYTQSTVDDIVMGALRVS